MDCETCVRRLTSGRSHLTDPVHCRRCHLTWTGNEAQHCVVCHRTFATITAADAHRRGVEHIDPAVTEGWREKRPGVWTNSAAWAGMA